MRLSYFSISLLLVLPVQAAITRFRLAPPSPSDRGRCNSFSVYIGMTQYPNFGISSAKFDQSGGVGADCSWSWTSQRTTFLAEYMGSHTMNRRNSDWNGGTNEGLFSMLRHMSPRTTWSSTLRAGQIDVSDNLFMPNSAMKSAQIGFRTDDSQGSEQRTDLALVAEAGRLPTDRFGLSGLRQRYAVFDSTLTYKHSERTSWYSQLQSDYTAYGRSVYVKPSTALALTSGAVGVGAGFDRLSTPRTTVGADFQVSRELVSSQQFLRGFAQARIDYVVTSRWSAEGSIGTASRRGLGALRSPNVTEVIGSGGIAYHGIAHSAVFSVARMLGTGLTAAYPSEVSVNFASIWERPHSRYSLSTTAQWAHSGDYGGSPVNFAQYGFAIGRKLSPTTSVFVQAARSSSQGAYLPGGGGALPLNAGPANLARAAFRISFVYTPRQRW
jgi:hypothetical protein